MSVSTQKRQVIQDLAGKFVNAAFLDCAKDAAPGSLVPAGGALEGNFITEPTALSTFQHRSVAVPIAYDRQIGDGSITVSVHAKLVYARSLHECTYYGSRSAQIRCRDRRG